MPSDLSMFFLNLLPLLQLIPVGGAIMADRYFYIPSVGLMLCFAFGLLEIRSTTIRYALFVLFILVSFRPVVFTYHGLERQHDAME